MSLTEYRTALVTGASSGIGEAVVRELCRRGLSVHAAARRGDRLDRLASETGCTACILDVRDTKAVYDVFSDLEVDVLVNNAGVGLGYESILAASPADIDATLTTNVTAAAQVLRAVLPGMVRRRRGHVVNLGSVAGLYPIGASIYGATKGAMRLLSQNLRMELQGTGIRVTEICPGRVETEFFAVAVGDAERAAEAFTDLQSLSAADVARAILYALEQPSHVNISAIELTPTEQFFGGDNTVSTMGGT